MGPFSWSGSIAQPVTSIPPAVGAVLSSDPKGWPPTTVAHASLVLTAPLPTLMA